eukprot:12077023-Alexandrium_andersonii.AAC.1
MALGRRRGVREKGRLEGAAKGVQRWERGSAAVAQSVLPSGREGAAFRREGLRGGDLRWALGRHGLRSRARLAGKPDRGGGTIRLRGHDALCRKQRGARRVHGVTWWQAL